MNVKMGLILALAILVLQTNSLMSQVVEDGLISYWSFDAADVRGNTVKDIVGGNDGTIVGAPKHVKGKISEAFEFGGEPDVIDVASPANGSLDFDEDQDFSMMAWIKVDKPPELDGGQSTIVSKGDGGNNARILWKIIGTQVNVTIANEAGGGPKLVLASAKEVVDGKWHHVLFVSDRSDTTRIYIDGKLDAEGGETKGTDITTESPLFIGASVRIGKTTRRYFEGLIDEVGIYNRVLTDNEIERNFNSKGLAVSPQEKLAIAWGQIKISR
ncbi:MAG: LamG domain-containing protein [Candidatus Poribacteria bacterium]|nr:LamG domain-containing protein [Candidatus Poribacteria bacterium]